MPKTKQTKMKRVLASALNHQELAAKGLVVLHETFEATHAEHAQYLAGLIKAQLQIQEMTLKFWEICWRKRPANYNAWR